MGDLIFRPRLRRAAGAGDGQRPTGSSAFSVTFVISVNIGTDQVEEIQRAADLGGSFPGPDLWKSLEMRVLSGKILVNWDVRRRLYSLGTWLSGYLAEAVRETSPRGQGNAHFPQTQPWDSKGDRESVEQAGETLGKPSNPRQSEAISGEMKPLD
ncbi:hypothetical protein B0H16DRAFT_1468383 [Mycena metata]|uniref:Uncharacterized protein n=1 Tax=Mycena metata TaxID=1033252 RepID=A0AAD7I2U1_9AGAR|nr:hypothetical protein B0H16DRAFT_1468383 [Mycena metata]